MKIGIEAQRIFRNKKHGMDVVALETIRQIQRLDISNEYILFARNGPDRSCVSATPTFHEHLVKGFTYADWEQVSLPAALRSVRPDLIHCTANTAPLRSPVPLVLTLHDIIYLEETDFHGSAYQNFGNLYRKMVVPLVIKNATKIVTVSEFERKVILGHYPQLEQKLSVLYNGVSDRYQQMERGEVLAQFKKSYRLPSSYILFLGNTAPKKNTAGLIKAYVHYCYIERDPLPIVITDYPIEKVLTILRGIGKEDLIKNFVLPGYFPSDKMPMLYNGASLFIYPSLRESFGLPVLEAMACGVPVITSNGSALPEIAGDAACFTDPRKIEAMAASIRELLSDEKLKDDLVTKGLQRVKQFSWSRTAEQLISLYASVLR